MLQPPIVLCFSGHDPCGGAGVQADIESIRSHQCHAVSIITALTDQDTVNVKQIYPQAPEQIRRQAETLFADMPIAAIKIGLIGHADTANVLADILLQHPRIPVVLDPVLAAGGGANLAGQDLLQVLRARLLPLTTVLTPNSTEARRLTGLQDLPACGQALRDQGVKWVLITGAHETTEQVDNHLFMPDGTMETYHWQRLPGEFHGSGCTLASAIAALMALGLDAQAAAHEAQDFTWQALEAAYRTGAGQFNPQRLFWVS